MSEIQVSPEYYIAPVLDVLNLSQAERDYLVALEQHNSVSISEDRSRTGKVLVQAAVDLRTEISGSRENINRPEVSDRLMGLQWAFEDVRRFMADQELNKEPNFGQVIAKYADGLVDRRTQDYTNFHSQVSSSPV